MRNLRNRLRAIFNRQGCKSCERFIEFLDKALDADSLNDYEIAWEYGDKHIWKRHNAAWKRWRRRGFC